MPNTHHTPTGHLMPMDLPAISLNLISRFVNGRSFADQALPSDQSYIDANDDEGM